MTEGPEMEDLPWTGERYIPGLTGDIELEHLHRYCLAKEFARDKDVLDIACGEGYGAATLAEVALNVIGVDASQETIEYASKRYAQTNLQFFTGTCSAIPLPDASVDVVVSFETIEHHREHHEMMQEFVRVLRPDGIVIISSPNKTEYSDKPEFNNPFHIKELYFDQFKELIQKYFTYYQFYGQRVRYGSYVGPIGEIPTITSNFHLSKDRIHRTIGIAEPMFYIAIASSKLLKNLSSGVFLSQAPNYLEQITNLQIELGEREKNLLNLREVNKASDQQILELQRENQSQKQHLVELQQKFAHLKKQKSDLQEQVIGRDKQVLEIHQDLILKNQRLIELQKSLALSDQKLNEFKNQEVELYQKISESDQEIVNLKKKVEKRVKQLETIVASKSWQITAPFRWVGYSFRNFHQILGNVIDILSGSGGLVNIVRKAKMINRNEGIAGFRFRIRSKIFGSGFLASQDIETEESISIHKNNYTEWIRQFDRLTNETRTAMCESIKAMNHRPLISVAMPTFNPRPEWLISTVESLRNQIYPNWELCIADDASTAKSVQSILERFIEEDSRIKVVYREKNGHISAATNDALQLATGDWVAFLDHDDLLAEHSLFWVADAINRHPKVSLIYSDEDKIDAKGRRFDPYFKCDWNLSLFYSHNLITHLAVYRADLLQKVGGLREGYEGAQDYDLALRCIERIESDQIHHIPRILYHWRRHHESTAQSSEAKPYAMLAGERALNDHFQRQRVNASAKLIGHGYRVSYDFPKSSPMVTLIIPTRNQMQLIRQCVESILSKTIYPNYEILIVDNGSDNPETLCYLESLETQAQVRVLRDNRPFNFSALNNAAVKEARGELVGLINNDIIVITPEWLTEMVRLAIQPKIGAVGARLWYPNDTLQHGGVILGIGGWAGHAHKGFPKGCHGYVGRMSLISEFSAITGACLVIQKAIYEKLGGLNEKDLQIACNDVDFCLRVRKAGYRNVWTPYAELYHLESATRGYEDDPMKKARFAKEVQYVKQQWGEFFLHDPAYSPNLTLDHEDFSLAWPPRVEQSVETSSTSLKNSPPTHT